MYAERALPTEILLRIFCLLSPLDVVRLRTVSKQFHDISYESEVWKALYTNARLPSPLGPFPSQSIQYLERTLVKSDLLAQSWTTRPMREVSTFRFRLGDSIEFNRFGRPKLIVDGRWAIFQDTSSESGKFVALDLDSKTMPPHIQILWEGDEPIKEWGVCEVMAVDGLVVYILVTTATPHPAPESLPPWKLLEFRVNGSGQLYHSFSLDVPTTKAYSSAVLCGGRGPFLYISGQDIFLHADNRQFYNPPMPRSGSLLFTKTHVINVQHDSHLVHAFTLPPGPPSASGCTETLRVSHEGITKGGRLGSDAHLLRNSLIDPLTGATNIRFLTIKSSKYGNTHLRCVDLILPEHTLADINTVLPIKSKNHVHENVQYFTSYPWMVSSEDGYARGLVWQSESRDRMTNDIDPLYYSYQVMRFTLDASQGLGKCRCVFGQPSFVHLTEVYFNSPVAVDCARGCLFYAKERKPGGAKNGEMIRVDVI